jgi:hypothetical protein
MVVPDFSISDKICQELNGGGGFHPIEGSW